VIVRVIVRMLMIMPGLVPMRRLLRALIARRAQFCCLLPERLSPRRGLVGGEYANTDSQRPDMEFHSIAPF
jgi:hypothetical protein